MTFLCFEFNAVGEGLNAVLQQQVPQQHERTGEEVDDDQAVQLPLPIQNVLLLTYPLSRS